MKAEPAGCLIAAINANSIIHGSMALRQKPIPALPLTLAMGRHSSAQDQRDRVIQASRKGRQQIPGPDKMGNIPLHLLGGPPEADQPGEHFLPVLRLRTQ